MTDKIAYILGSSVHFAGFFQNLVDTGAEPTSGKPFNSLYKMVKVGGSALYQTVSLVCWILCAIMMLIAIMSYASGANQNQRFMSKTSIGRMTFICIALGGLLGFVALFFRMMA